MLVWYYISLQLRCPLLLPCLPSSTTAHPPLPLPPPSTHAVAWLEHYLITQPNITCMVVSHDSGFLDNVTTDIIHYETRKLKHYR
jgi:hypothetical protein